MKIDEQHIFNLFNNVENNKICGFSGRLIWQKVNNNSYVGMINNCYWSKNTVFTLDEILSELKITIFGADNFEVYPDDYIDLQEYVEKMYDDMLVGDCMLIEAINGEYKDEIFKVSYKEVCYPIFNDKTRDIKYSVCKYSDFSIVENYDVRNHKFTVLK